MILGGTEYFKTNGIHNLKSTFKFGSEETETFVFITIELTQNSAYSICTEQNNYIASISEISQLKQRMSHVNSPLTNAERTQYRSALGQLLWVPNISRQDISFHVCEASTKLKNATVADIYYVNKIIRNVKSTKNCIKFPHLDLKTLQLKLFTDASFNNLNGGSQGGQIIFITNGNNNLCPLCWNSSQIKRVKRSTIAAKTLSLVDRCDVTVHINNLLSEPLHTEPNCLSITAYTDNQSLYGAAYSMKKTFKKHLLVDTSAIREIINKNEITVTCMD